MRSARARSPFFLLVVAAILAVGTAIAFACVPQRGKLDVINQDTGTEVDASTASNSPDWIIGDGDPDTRDANSWCGDGGGHPVEAVWASDGDSIKVEVEEASASSVSGGPDQCPQRANKLPTAGVTDGTFVYLENGLADDTSPNVYEWDETNNPGGHYENGFWNFVEGDGHGCYVPDREPILQDRFTVNSNGSGSTSFALDAFQSNDFTGNVNDPDPGDGASVLCVGNSENSGGDARAIYGPVVVSSV